MLHRASMLMICMGLMLGCGRLQFEPTPQHNASIDAMSNDGSMDANMDANMDAGHDAMIDAGHDADDRDSNVTEDAATDATDDAGFDAGAPRDLDYCNEVPRLRADATIDGVLEAGLLLRTITPVDWTAPIELMPTDQPSAYAVAWQDDAIYVYVKVVDPTRLPALPGASPWTGDGAEFYIDGDGVYTNAPMYDPDAMQWCTAAPANDTTPVAIGEGFRDATSFGAWTPGNFNAFPTSDGYVLEGLVFATDMMLPSWSFALGGHIGFDISINVSGPSFTPDPNAGVTYPRVGQYFLKVNPDEPDNCLGRPYCQPLAFCTPVLID